MRYLLYCIFRSQEPQEPKSLLGVDAQPVFLVAKNGLSAVISGTKYGALTPNIPRILAYKKVIESLHRNHTVIPMRYGSLLEKELQVLQLLEERGTKFMALLRELEGCVEMGIRVLLSDSGFRISDSATLIRPYPITNPQSSNPGRSFIAARKAHYAREEQSSKETDMVFQRCRAAFSGLFVKCKEEYSRFNISYISSRNPLHSLYFLVPRKSLESFRQVFRQITFRESAKLLLSGPWPPYNFVLDDNFEIHRSPPKAGQRIPNFKEFSFTR